MARDTLQYHPLAAHPALQGGWLVGFPQEYGENMSSVFVSSPQSCDTKSIEGGGFCFFDTAEYDSGRGV